MKKIKNITFIGMLPIWFGLVTTMVGTAGCKKFMDTPLPSDRIAAEGAFQTNASTSSVLSGVFYNMVNNGFINGAGSYSMGLYADELTNLNPSSSGLTFYTNSLTNLSTQSYWTTQYQLISQCNVAIEGINQSTALLTNKNQYLGEAYVARAFLYFNLVNTFGGVPLVINTDHMVNKALPRSSVSEVYARIIADATTAASLLPADFRDANGLAVSTRVRPNKYAAQALLARAYLYTGDWQNAEKWATEVIANSTLFKLRTPALTFTSAGNTELIWGLRPTAANFVFDYTYYNNGMPATLPAGKTILSYSVNASLSNSLVTAFEAGDTRFTGWVRTTVDPVNNKTYYYPNKYKSNANAVEDLVLIRLAELYLIRSEARARQNDLSGARADIDVIRSRAGLGATAAASQAELLLAVEQERRVELFTEWGHRFFDLKRTGKIDALMTILAPQKGGSWASFKQLWPIYANDILLDPNLTQNPGYN